MAFAVRLHGYRGIAQARFVNPTQYSGDSVYMLMQPQEWSQVVTTAGATPVSSVAQPSPDASTMVRIEIPDGQSIRFEVNPPGRSVNAGNSSPILSGITQLFWGAGWTISVAEGASFP